MARIGIAGAGVLGRLLAWQLGHAGHVVTVFDPAPGPQAPPVGGVSQWTLPRTHPPTAAAPTGFEGLVAPGPGPLVTPLQPARGAAGFTAAGMLSPIAELDNAGPALARLGWRSLALWREVAAALREQGCNTPLFAQHGSLMLAHGSDLGAAHRVLARLEAAVPLAPEWPAPQALDRAALTRLEPAIAPDLHAWLLPHEAQVMGREMLQALAVHAPQVHWRWGVRADRVEAGRITLSDGQVCDVDWAMDMRGLGAALPRTACGAHPLRDGQRRPGEVGSAPALDDGMPVRGVRGEVVWLHAPGVHLQRPVRLLHPRHRVYIVPRPGDLFVIGASEIESEDPSPVSLRSAVELMAAAHSALPELAEARIVHLEANLRPALPDNGPHTHSAPGLLRINGLFRHGWLLAPALVQDALEGIGLPPAPLRGAQKPGGD